MWRDIQGEERGSQDDGIERIDQKEHEGRKRIVSPYICVDDSTSNNFGKRFPVGSVTRNRCTKKIGVLNYTSTSGVLGQLFKTVKNDSGSEAKPDESHWPVSLNRQTIYIHMNNLITCTAK